MVTWFACVSSLSCIYPYKHIGIREAKERHNREGGEREKGCKKGKDGRKENKMKMDKKETNEIRMRRCYDELWV